MYDSLKSSASAGATKEKKGESKMSLLQYAPLVRELTAAELTAADILPAIPYGMEIREVRTITGRCDLCKQWDSNLIQGVCDFCDSMYVGARS